MCRHRLVELLCVLSGEVGVTLTTDEGMNVPVKVIDNHDRTYRVEFEPTTVGTYNTNVTFAGQTTPDSPYKVNVQPPAVDTSKVRVTDLPDSKWSASAAGHHSFMFQRVFVHCV